MAGKNKAQIDLSENALYIVKDGKLTKVLAKEHGEDQVIWKDGKVLDVIRSQRARLNGQEVI